MDLEGFNNELKVQTPINASILTLIEQLNNEDNCIENKIRESTLCIYDDDVDDESELKIE